jgi:tetratricopeptide (TPR) repeat protein
MGEIAVNTPMQGGQGNDGATPSKEELRDALTRVVSSDAFVSAPRLQQFLTYVVGEAIAGRGAAISGKTIAVDVYDRDSSGVESGQNLVRVEARRLRRRLNEYYAEPGADDPWRILIDLGGYTPRFKPGAPDTAKHVAPSLAAGSPYRKRVILAVVAIVVTLSVAIMATNMRSVNPEIDSPSDQAERAAYRERSMPALQAVNLAEQTRGMLFPLFDLKRQELALQMFRHAISLDPGLHNGYSGAAQVLATFALMSTDSISASGFLEEAAVMTEVALDLAPSSAWAQSANGWVLAVSGDPTNALSSARLAVELGPEDGHVLDLAGVTALIAGFPQFAAEASDPERPRSGIGRFGANNIWGVSQFVLGNYAEVIVAFSTAAESGAPVSAPSLIFLAAAYDHVGDAENATRTVAELNTTWPEFPAKAIMDRIFSNSPAIGDDVLGRLAKHGYPDSAIRLDIN